MKTSSFFFKRSKTLNVFKLKSTLKKKGLLKICVWSLFTQDNNLFSMIYKYLLLTVFLIRSGSPDKTVNFFILKFLILYKKNDFLLTSYMRGDTSGSILRLVPSSDLCN